MSTDKLVAQYADALSHYVRFTQKLEALLTDLLLANAIAYHVIESRTKDVQSFRDKITRSSKAYTDPITELTDLSGIRVIAYYQDDAASIGRLIESEFQVDQHQSLIQVPAPTEFGYRSSHYVVQLSEVRSRLMEWHGLGHLKAEIQVRTVLQHAWAAISHKLQYKREDDVPAQLRRKLFRLSALFELADDEFVSLRDASGDLTRTIGSQLSAGNRQIAIDALSLGQFLDTSRTVAQLCAMAAEAGFSFEVPDGHESVDESATLSDLIQLAALADLCTIENFESVLTAALPWAESYLRAQYAAGHTSRKNDWHVTPPFVCQLVLIRTKIEMLRPGYLQRLGWNRSIAARVYQIAKEFRPGEV